MYLTTIAGGSGDTYRDVQGNTLILTGNDRLWPGRTVWTDGRYIFASVQQSDIPAGMPIISRSNSLIYPYLVATDPQQELADFKFFDKNFKTCELAKGCNGYFVGGRCNSYIIGNTVIYNLGTGAIYNTQFSLEQTVDATVDNSGNLVRLIKKPESESCMFAYRNNDLIKTYDIPDIQGCALAKIRPDCSIYGLFVTHSKNSPGRAVPEEVPAYYRQYTVNYVYMGDIAGTPKYGIQYDYVDCATTTTVTHYQSSEQVITYTIFYYDSRKEIKKEVFRRTDTGGNVKSEYYYEGSEYTNYPFQFAPGNKITPGVYNGFTDNAGFILAKDSLDGYSAGYYINVPSHAGLTICVGSPPGGVYVDDSEFDDCKRKVAACLVNNVPITTVVAKVQASESYPQNVDVQSQPFDFPTSDDDSTEPMHCTIDKDFSVEWQCLGTKGNLENYIGDAIKIGGQTYFKMLYSGFCDQSGNVVITDMSPDNLRIKGTMMKETLQKNITKTQIQQQ